MNLRLDNLQFAGLEIFQDPKGYCFTSDSVLLANFVKFLPEKKVVEFCSGSGVISILLSKKQKPKEIHAFEIDKKPFELLKKNIEHNNLQNIIFAHNEKLEDASKILSVGYADVVVCNPPYLKADGREKNEITNATMELSTTLENVIKSASEVLKYGGKLFMVHRVDRLVDVIAELRKYALEPKLISVIYPKENAEPVVFLVQATLKGRPGLRMSKVIYANEMNKA